MSDELNSIFNSIVEGQEAAALSAVVAALNAGLAPTLILSQGMIAAMTEVGRRFETGEYFVPEMMMAARIMRAGLSLLKPHLSQAEVAFAGRAVIGSVKGDLHDIGKDLVAMMLEGAGFAVINLGVDVKPETFVEAVRQHQPHLVGLSAMLTTTMPEIQATIQALAGAGLRRPVKVIIGGAPVTEAFVYKVGADGYAQDASRAVGLAKSLVDV